MGFLNSESAIEGEKVEAKLGDTLSYCFGSKLCAFKCDEMGQNEWLGRKKKEEVEKQRWRCLRVGNGIEMASNVPCYFVRGYYYL